MNEAERLAHVLWTAEHEDKNAIVDGRRRKEVWQDLIYYIRLLSHNRCNCTAEFRDRREHGRQHEPTCPKADR